MTVKWPFIVCLLLGSLPSFAAEFDSRTNAQLKKLAARYCFVSIRDHIPKWASSSPIVSYCGYDRAYQLSVSRKSRLCRLAAAGSAAGSSSSESGPFFRSSAFKYGPQLARDVREGPLSARHRVLLSAYAAVDPEELQWLERNFDAQNMAHNLWMVELSNAQIQRLADENWVDHIQRSPTRTESHNEDARETVRSEHVQVGGVGALATTSPPNYLLSGSGLASEDGIRVALFESTGVLRTHREFDGEKFYACECHILKDEGTGCASECVKPPGNHATVGASIIAGNGFAGSCASGGTAPCPDSDYHFRGHAPGASLGEFGITLAEYSRLFSAFVTKKSDLSVHAYYWRGDGLCPGVDGYCPGSYDKLSASIDHAIRGGPYFKIKTLPSKPQVWTSGNSRGFHKVENVAKNAIVVGALPASGGRFTAMGPSPDGRVKPDLLAVGYDVHTAVVGSDSDYDTKENGESSAAGPVVAGIMALMIESILSSSDSGPRGFAYPATYKSVLLNSATDLVGMLAGNHYGTGPDYATGYGLVNAEEATELASNSRRWRESSIDHNDMHTYCLMIDGDEDLKVTVAWDDPPSCPINQFSQGGGLVNDLDLELISPSNVLSLPLLAAKIPMDPPDPSNLGNATRGRDSLNNVEQVLVNNPEPGQWKVKVKGFHVPVLWQTYGLASSTSFTRCDDWGREAAPPSGKFVLGPKPVLIEDVCRYMGQCSLCVGAPGGYCPDMKIKLYDMPKDAVAVLIDGAGNELARSKHRFWRPRSVRTFRYDSTVNRGAVHLDVLRRDGKRYPHEIRPRIRIR